MFFAPFIHEAHQLSLGLEAYQRASVAMLAWLPDPFTLALARLATGLFIINHEVRTVFFASLQPR